MAAGQPLKARGDGVGIPGFTRWRFELVTDDPLQRAPASLLATSIARVPQAAGRTGEVAGAVEVPGHGREGEVAERGARPEHAAEEPERPDEPSEDREATTGPIDQPDDPPRNLLDLGRHPGGG